MRRFLTWVLVLTVPLTAGLCAGQQTIGLFTNNTSSFEGYTLFAPLQSTNTYLIDNAGRTVHRWASGSLPGQSAYLRENGRLLRAVRVQSSVLNGAGYGGGVQELDWDGTVLWDFTYADALHWQHHDVEGLPNGNTLLVAWEAKTQAEAIAAGRNTNFVTADGLWPEHIVEIEPNGTTNGTIVWEWHLWDHMVQDYDPTKANYGNVTNHPELVDINFPSENSDADWIHCNSVKYSPSLDQIVISARPLSELWVIDHSTTTAEAASHTGGTSGKGGDLLYRWGNPQAYRRGTTTEQTLFLQHDAQWIATNRPGAGNLLIFNNGGGRPDGDYSSIDEIATPVDANGNYSLDTGASYGPAAPLWTYTATPATNLYAAFVSGAQRLPNGNTLICSGPDGVFLEVTAAGETVWKYVNPVSSYGPMTQGTTPSNNLVFKIRRYAPEYAGLAGRDLTPGDMIEIDPDTTTPTNASLWCPEGPVSAGEWPIFAWQPVSDATWYQLWINRDGAYHWADWIKGSNTWTPSWDMSDTPGAYEWWVQTWGTNGFGPWSDPKTFWVNVPGQVALSSPTGSVSGARPPFNWTTDTQADWYRVWINKDGAYHWTEWIEGSNTWTPWWNMNDTPGAYEWWVQTWGTDGFGPWSEPKTFWINVPGQVTLRSPTGTVSVVRPPFSWAPDADAAWYHVWVHKDGEYHWADWIKGSNTWTPTWDMTDYPGAYEWWVQPWGTDGYGPWSEPETFWIGVPGRAEPVTPGASQSGGQLTFAWSPLSEATWYQIYLNRDGAYYYSEWGEQATWTPSWTLPSGNYEWWVQGWNANGYGAWSSSRRFTVE